MTRWTKEAIAEAREEVRDLGVFALEYAKPTDTFGITMALALAELGLKCIDPSPEDVERVARGLIETIGSPWEWPDMPSEVKALWRRHARVALVAIPEEGR